MIKAAAAQLNSIPLFKLLIVYSSWWCIIKYSIKCFVQVLFYYLFIYLFFCVCFLIRPVEGMISFVVLSKKSYFTVRKQCVHKCECVWVEWSEWSEEYVRVGGDHAHVGRLSICKPLSVQLTYSQITHINDLFDIKMILCFSVDYFIGGSNLVFRLSMYVDICFKTSIH